MLVHSCWSGYLAILGFSSTVCAAPVADPQLQSRADPPGLRGSQSLLGNTGTPVDKSDSALVEDYDLVPGQKSDADLGFYFDFTKAQNPQPIRGSKGGTDPGPSMRNP